MIWKAFPEHSMMSTLLLDDSIYKAQKQPHNHIQIPEYIRQSSNDQDTALLATIGILQELKSTTDVSSWIRDGGIVKLEGLSRDEAQNIPWFLHPALMKHWEEKGRACLHSLGITIGMTKRLGPSPNRYMSSGR